jgi:hypothetical protein
MVEVHMYAPSIGIGCQFSYLLCVGFGDLLHSIDGRTLNCEQGAMSQIVLDPSLNIMK